MGSQREPARPHSLNTFGPFYPPLLQVAVSHAERVATLVSSFEASPARYDVSSRPRYDGWAWAWVTGRASEIESVVEQAAGAWRRGVLGERDATARIDHYLDLLHDGMRRHLGMHAPSCCGGAFASTAVPVQPGDTTLPQLVQRRQDASTNVDGQHSIDELLEGILASASHGDP